MTRRTFMGNLLAGLLLCAGKLLGIVRRTPPAPETSWKVRHYPTNWDGHAPLAGPVPGTLGHNGTVAPRRRFRTY